MEPNRLRSIAPGPASARDRPLGESSDWPDHL